MCGCLDAKTLLERRARIMFVVVHRGTIKSGQADADERMRSRGRRTSSFKAQLPRVVNLQGGRFGKKEGDGGGESSRGLLLEREARVDKGMPSVWVDAILNGMHHLGRR